MIAINIASVFLLCMMASVVTSSSVARPTYRRLTKAKEGFDLGLIIDGRTEESYTARGRITPVLSQSIVSIPLSPLREKSKRKPSMRHRLLTASKASCDEITESPTYCPYMAGHDGSAASSNFGSGAISPWVLSDDLDVDRDPEHLTQACCACFNCVNMTGPTPTRMADYYSVPVKAVTTVHKHVDGERRKISVTIFAGCTCMYKPF